MQELGTFAIVRLNRLTRSRVHVNNNQQQKPAQLTNLYPMKGPEKRRKLD